MHASSHLTMYPKITKSFLIYILICSILMNGCAFYVPITVEDKSEGLRFNDQDIILVLFDGSRIDSKANFHVLVEQPSDFVFGTGWDRSSSQQFRGKLPFSLIDSSRNIADKGQTIESGGKSLICWLKDGRSIIFRETTISESRLLIVQESIAWIAREYH